METRDATAVLPRANAAGSATRLCRNCGAHAPSRYCPQCGQETTVGAPTLGQFCVAFLRTYAGRRGILWQTLRRLVLAPGALTVEYLAGRRARYVRPLRLYLAISVMVFAAVQGLNLDVGLRFYGDHGIRFLRSSPVVVEDGASVSAITPVRIVLDHVNTPAIRRFRSMTASQRFQFLHARRAQYVSYLLFLLVPVFAGILALCYRDRHVPFAGHLVFGAHVHSFLLLAFLVDAALPTLGANLLSLLTTSYFYLALRRVYGGPWPQVLGKGTIAIAAYFASGLAANVFLVLALLSF